MAEATIADDNGAVIGERIVNEFFLVGVNGWCPDAYGSKTEHQDKKQSIANLIYLFIIYDVLVMFL